MPSLFTGTECVDFYCDIGEYLTARAGMITLSVEGRTSDESGIYRIYKFAVRPSPDATQIINDDLDEVAHRTGIARVSFPLRFGLDPDDTDGITELWPAP